MHVVANVDCVACHRHGRARQAEGQGMAMISFKATEAACVDCHGTAIEGTLQMWQSALDETLLDAKAQVAQAEAQ